MIRFVLARLASGFLVVVAVATISFFLLKAAPGSPFDDERVMPPEIKRKIDDIFQTVPQEDEQVQVARKMREKE